jgi:2-dehydro-3-deoxygalactonokinase
LISASLASLAEYLSGLLIGHELVSGIAGAGDLTSVPLVMIGAPSLCQRYVHSLKYMGQSADAVLDNTAPAGLWNLAMASGRIA